MIVRFNIDPCEDGLYEYSVSYEGEELYGDTGLNTMEACIDSAVEGLGQDAIGAELSYKGIISGTYPLATLAVAAAQVAGHALNTTLSIEEAGEAF